MDPKSLIAPVSPIGYPTPFWFIEFFKVLGFALHVVPMNIWYAGALIAAGLGIFGKGNARLVGHHVARSLPFMLAFGINFGIIPLLFLQVAYYQFFYPATILIAWPWFAIFWLVMIAYFGTYLYRLAVRGGIKSEVASVGESKTENRASKLLDITGKAGIIAAAGIFIVVGFIFANALSLMTNVDGWWGIFKHTNVSSAATGIALNTNDPTLIPRWLFMFGLAITTTAAFIIVDAAFLSGRETQDYRQYASRFAFIAYTLGLLWYAGFGSWYIFGTISGTVREMLAHPIMRVIFTLTALSPGLPWLLIFLQRKLPTRTLAALVGITQFGVVGLNAVSRQWVQNREIAPFANIARHHLDPQPGATVLFLVLFVGGLTLVGWMVSKIIQVNRSESLHPQK